MNQSTQPPNLEQWQLIYDDRAALLKNPEAQQRTLIELANRLHAQGVIDDSELAERLEQADAAFAWGVEEGEQT